MDDNYLLHHQSIIIQEAENYIDHNQEIDTPIDPKAEITETIKDLETTIEIITIEAHATIEVIITESEITVITEILIIIIDITIDLINHIQIEVPQDKIHRIIEIITTTTIIIIKDKDYIAETQLEMTDIDKVK